MFSGGSGQLEGDFERFGIDPELMPRRERLGVYPENLDAIHFFMRLQTQWTISPMGERIGLHYPSVETAARVLGVSLTPDLFDKVQIMEMTALKVLRRG